jgi:DNA-binding HxlR family transcriptional regulator
MRWNDLGTEHCSVARTVSVIGDRWTLLILRDCFLRIRRFEAFEERIGVTRHILADRLRKLVAEGVLRKIAYQERPTRHEYRLTQKGLDLFPVIMSLVHWGDDPVMVCSECRETLDPRQVRVMPGPGAGTSAGTSLALLDLESRHDAEASVIGET